MAEFPALPIFTDALLGDTLHLTNAQFGSYMLLLIVAWRTNECALPNDDVFLAKIARMDKRVWAMNKSLIMGFFKLGEDGLFRQGRLTDERKYVEQKRQKNIAAGRVSALKRKNRHSTDVTTDVQPEVNQPTSPNPQPTIKRERENAHEDVNNLFDRFWEIFPRQRRGSRQEALKAYRKATTRATEEEIYEGTRRYASSDEVARGWGKGAAAWLNDDRWTVEYRIVPASGPSKPRTTYADSIADAAKAALDNINHTEEVRQKMARG